MLSIQDSRNAFLHSGYDEIVSLLMDNGADYESDLDDDDDDEWYMLCLSNYKNSFK